MHDTRLEERLRQVLRAEGDSLSLTVTADQLEQRLRLRRSERANRRLILATAAALVLAVGAGGGLLLTNRGTTPPAGATPSPSASAAPASPTASIAPVDDIAPYAGWQTLGRLNGPGAEPNPSVTGQVPEGVTSLLISAACSGSGRLLITDSGGGQLPVDCPATSTEPARIISSPGDGAEFFVVVAPTGAVTFQVLVEGSDVPLRIPPIILRHGADEAVMGHGCGGVITLAWGYESSDSCGTTLPSTPLETMELAEGDVATVTIDGWTIADASASCGRIVSQSGSPDVVEPMPECTVAATLGDSTITVSGLPKAANAWVLELSLTARNTAGDSFSGPNYVFIHVR